MVNVAICDDEQTMRERLHCALVRFFRERSQEVRILEYVSADALLENYPAEVDLLLLDIYMDGTDGMAAAARIRAFDQDVCIIFITTMYQRAIEGYSVRAFGFIRKPVNYTELQHELGCAMLQIQRNREHSKFLTLRAGANTQRILIRGISYCEVRNHTILICTGGEIQEYRGQMKDLEAQLLPYGFFRCHASYLVNGRHIRRIDQTELTLTSGTVIPISQRRRKEFLDALSKYIGEQI